MQSLSAPVLVVVGVLLLWPIDTAETSAPPIVADESLVAVDAKQLYDETPFEIQAPQDNVVAWIWRAPDSFEVEENTFRMTVSDCPDGEHRIKCDIIRQDPMTKDVVQSTLFTTIIVRRGPPPEVEPPDPPEVEPDPTKVRSVYLVEETNDRTPQMNSTILGLRGPVWDAEFPNTPLYIMDKDSANLPEEVRLAGGSRAPPYVVYLPDQQVAPIVKEYDANSITAWDVVNDAKAIIKGE